MSSCPSAISPLVRFVEGDVPPLPCPGAGFWENVGTIAAAVALNQGLDEGDPPRWLAGF